MADAKKDDAKKYSMIPGKPAFIVGLICVVIGYFQMYPEHVDNFLKRFERSGAVASPTPKLERSSAAQREPIRIELDSERWVEVTIPPGYNWRINRPGCWEQYWFWSEAEPRPRVESGDRTWFGEIPECNFRVRGTKGPAEVVMAPK